MACKILDTMLLQYKGQLTHEVLHTFMYEVSAIINSRPVTPISTDPDDPIIISLAMLLTQKTGFDPIPDLDGDMKNMYKLRRDGNVFVCCPTYSGNDGKENI